MPTPMMNGLVFLKNGNNMGYYTKYCFYTKCPVESRKHVEDELFEHHWMEMPPFATPELLIDGK